MFMLHVKFGTIGTSLLLTKAAFSFENTVFYFKKYNTSSILRLNIL